MKKLLSLVLVLAMVLSMGLSVAQADEPTKIIWWVYAASAQPNLHAPMPPSPFPGDQWN